MWPEVEGAGRGCSGGGLSRIGWSSRDGGLLCPQVATYLTLATLCSSTQAADILRSWDSDGDGVINRKEFHKSVRALGLEASDEEMDALFDALDDDRYAGGSSAARCTRTAPFHALCALPPPSLPFYATAAPHATPHAKTTPRALVQPAPHPPLQVGPARA